jgi:hypothetical protein
LASKGAKDDGRGAALMKANCPVPALRGGQSSAFDPRASGLAILIALPAQQRDDGPRRHENLGNVGQLTYLVHRREGAFFDPPREGGAWINHYHSKSAEEFLRSRARGTGDQPLGTNLVTDFVLREFLAQHRRSDLVRDERILSCAPSFDYHYRKLTGIPGIAEALSNIELASRIE